MNTETITRPERTPSPPYVPFRFLDLPQEIQDKIYPWVYAEKYDLGVYMIGPLKDRGRRKRYDHEAEPEDELIVDGSNYWYDNLAQVNKKIREDSRKARQAAFKGALRVAWDEDYNGQAFLEFREDKWATLRSLVTDLSIGGMSGRSCVGLNEDFWDAMPVLFPQVKTITVRYDVYRRQHVDRDMDTETSEWKRVCSDGYDDDFDAGRMDDEFSFPADFLELRNLARVMENARGCTIFLKTDVNWTNNRYHSVYWQVSRLPTHLTSVILMSCGITVRQVHCHFRQCGGDFEKVVKCIDIDEE